MIRRRRTTSDTVRILTDHNPRPLQTRNLIQQTRQEDMIKTKQGLLLSSRNYIKCPTCGSIEEHVKSQVWWGERVCNTCFNQYRDSYHKAKSLRGLE